MAAVKALQQWCRLRCEGYRDVSITNMTTSFRDGLAFCALIHRHRPDLIDFDSLMKENVLENNRLAFSVAEQQLGIPALLDPEDMVALRVPDRLSILTYVSQYYNYFHGRSPIGGMAGVKRPAEGATEQQPSGKKNAPVSAKVFPSSGPTKENRPPVDPSWPAPATTHDVRRDVPAAHPPQTGTLSNKCVSCNKHVHLVQRHLVEGKLYHRNCAKTLTGNPFTTDRPQNSSGSRLSPPEPGPVKAGPTWLSHKPRAPSRVSSSASPPRPADSAPPSSPSVPPQPPSAAKTKRTSASPSRPAPRGPVAISKLESAIATATATPTPTPRTSIASKNLQVKLRFFQSGDGDGGKEEKGGRTGHVELDGGQKEREEQKTPTASHSVTVEVKEDGKNKKGEQREQKEQRERKVQKEQKLQQEQKVLKEKKEQKEREEQKVQKEREEQKVQKEKKEQKEQKEREEQKVQKEKKEQKEREEQKEQKEQKVQKEREEQKEKKEQKEREVQKEKKEQKEREEQKVQKEKKEQKEREEQQEQKEQQSGAKASAAAVISKKLVEENNRPAWTVGKTKQSAETPKTEAEGVRGRVRLRANPSLLSDLTTSTSQDPKSSPANESFTRPWTGTPRSARNASPRSATPRSTSPGNASHGSASPRSVSPRSASPRRDLTDSREASKPRNASPNPSGAPGPADWRARLKPVSKEPGSAASKTWTNGSGLSQSADRPAPSISVTPPTHKGLSSATESSPLEHAPHKVTSRAEPVTRPASLLHQSCVQSHADRIPQRDILKELQQIEDSLNELERTGVELERKLRTSEENGEDESVMNELMVDWFCLIRNKQVAMRRESELVYIGRTQELEEKQPTVEQELRRLVDKPDHLKLPWERRREKELMDKLVEIVNDRNAIVEGLDEDRLREEEEDEQLNQLMMSFNLKKDKKKKSPMARLFTWGSKDT